MKNRECPLTPAQIVLLQTCADNHTHSTKDLKRILCIEPNTINTHFKHIRDIYGDLDRFGLLCVVAEDGWIRFPVIQSEKITKNGDAFLRAALLQSSRIGRKTPARLREESRKMITNYYCIDGELI